MFFLSKRSYNTKSSSSSLKLLDVWLKKLDLALFRKTPLRKTLLRTTFSVVVVNLPTDCILSFFSPAETDVLVPVFSQSTYVVVVNFLVVLKFPIILAERVLILSLAARSVHARIGSGVQFRLGHSVWYSQLPSNKP